MDKYWQDYVNSTVERDSTKSFLHTTLLLHDENTPHYWERSVIWPHLRNGDVIDRGRRIPVGIQVIVSPLEWSRSRPVLV